jgi:hypothetical protein
MAMDDLTERIKASIENRNSHLWFPELTADLATREWHSLRRDIGLTPQSYGTDRVLSHSISAPRQIIGTLKGSSFLTGTPAIAIEVFSQECAAEYQKAGVSFYSSDEILHTTVLSCLEDAIATISQVPSLMRTVATLVRSLHVIRPKDEEFDVSFSEPHVPFSIFVSIPEERIPSDAARVAEAIVHEAMHLQLTLIEQAVGLVVASSKEFFSPWKGEYRTIRGVLHGVYVFRVIDQFLRALLSKLQGVHPEELYYVGSRRGEIALQMMAIRNFEECSDLTALGRMLAKTLISDMSECFV